MRVLDRSGLGRAVGQSLRRGPLIAEVTERVHDLQRIFDLMWTADFLNVTFGFDLQSCGSLPVGLILLDLGPENEGAAKGTHRIDTAGIDFDSQGPPVLPDGR